MQENQKNKDEIYSKINNELGALSTITKLAEFAIDYDAENDPNYDIRPGFLYNVFCEINQKCDNLFELYELASQD